MQISPKCLIYARKLLKNESTNICLDSCLQLKFFSRTIVIDASLGMIILSNRTSCRCKRCLSQL